MAILKVRYCKLPVKFLQAAFFVAVWAKAPGGQGGFFVQGISKSAALILALSATVVVLTGYIFISRDTASKAQTAASVAQAVPMEQNQAEYVKPETPIDRSKNVTLPGWGGFTIPANTSYITQGFEFHNPAENMWYEDWVSINGTELEKLVVDSGDKTELDHYLKLAGIRSSAVEVTDVDESCFTVAKNDDGALTLEAIQGFDGTKTLTVRTEDGQDVTLSIACKEECYYISFGLFLEDGDECLYQSGLVAPGLYVQQMDLSRPLAAGEYAAYVVCQPYKSDQTTKTNSGVVKITLTVK